MIESNLLHFIMSVVLFPTLFQDAFLNFAWGADSHFILQISKRLFLLLPVLGFIGACWITIVALISVIFRHNRQHFFVSVIITWWDLGKAVLSFWGGIFQFAWTLLFAVIGFLKIVFISIWTVIRDIIIFPFQLLGNAAKNVVGTSVPWIAVTLTLFWCIIEAVIFTYVMTPLVIDVFSNITGTQLAVNAVRVPLYIFLLFVVLGSYAILSTFLETAKKKKVSEMIGIGIIELVVLLVEVVFLYREFVDSLVPWFAQYSENFELGILWTLVIACFVWFGIRSLSWFLFASYGTPTLLNIIQGRGVDIQPKENKIAPAYMLHTQAFVQQIRKDGDWIQEKGEEVLAAFILPPLQVIAATINFPVLLVTSKHLFEIPFSKLSDIRPSSELISELAKEKPAKKESRSDMDKGSFNAEGSL